MALQADEIMDRRQLRRRVSFWRIVTFVVAAIALAAIYFASGMGKNIGATSVDHVAKVKIEGTIVNDEPLLKLLGTLKENEQVKGVIVEVSSPGGTTVGGEAIFEAVRELAEEKPVVASVGTLAASAGYMIASATDHIVARRSSIVGSIGVIFQYGNVTELLDKVGVKMEEVKSSPLKAEPSPFNETTEEEREVLERIVKDSYNWFVDLVADRRNMERSKVLGLADGSIYTGGQGLENGLIDAIGGEAVARKWLEEERDIDGDLKTIEWKPKRPGDSLFGAQALLPWIGDALGFPVDRKTGEAIREALPDRLFLDGLLSIWVNSTGAENTR